MPGADWRSESSYDEASKAETVDIAWEWLRRDREYKKRSGPWSTTANNPARRRISSDESGA
ncbi:transcriptional regulator domain-containing protein [Bradyrhizobium sp. CCBAU 21362]|uniref:transcriptional regulator domain-containing protein n=1 Tax=Bradyrhizobium sp. CCBAU 21362 TaxID=1325082 RepID=UPI003FA4A26F